MISEVAPPPQAYGSEDKLGIVMGYQGGEYFHSTMTRPGEVGS